MQLSWTDNTVVNFTIIHNNCTRNQLRSHNMFLKCLFLIIPVSFHYNSYQGMILCNRLNPIWDGGGCSTPNLRKNVHKAFLGIKRPWHDFLISRVTNPLKPFLAKNFTGGPPRDPKKFKNDIFLMLKPPSAPPPKKNLLFCKFQHNLRFLKKVGYLGGGLEGG